MEIRSCMKRDVASINQTETIEQAVELFVGRHIGTLPVVNDAGKLVGLLQLRDLLSLVMPDFVKLIEDFDFVHNFGVLEARRPTKAMLAQQVSEVMNPPLSVEEDAGLLRATAILHNNRLLDMPVVDKEGHLVGIASRVDIGTAVMQGWLDSPQKGS